MECLTYQAWLGAVCRAEGVASASVYVLLRRVYFDTKRACRPLHTRKQRVPHPCMRTGQLFRVLAALPKRGGSFTRGVPRSSVRGACVPHTVPLVSTNKMPRNTHTKCYDFFICKVVSSTRRPLGVIVTGTSLLSEN